MHVCVEPVVAGTQSCQNHLAGPVKKVVCILLLSGFQRVLVLRIWLADLLARCQGFRSVLGSIGELLCMCCRVLAFVLLGGETCFVWRASNTDNASVMTVGKQGSKESLTKVAACLSASVSSL